jgi:hypothetical protein
MNTRTKRWTTLGLGAGLLAMSGVALSTAADHHTETASDAPSHAEVGKPAPDFELTDIDGKKHKLSSYKGKTIVLEWWNPECPAVVHHYKHEERGLFKNWANELHSKDEYVWLTINSGAPGEQGAGLEKSKHYRKEYNMTVPILLDEDGTVGRLYRARVTPEMYVIDPEGILRYHGAIDNAPWGREPEGELINYVARALEQLRNGETVSPDTTRAYGCTVKYARGAAPARGERGQRGERPQRDGQRPQRGGGTGDR